MKSVPQSDSSFETFGRPVADWQARLTRSLQASDQNLGHWEEEIPHQTRALIGKTPVTMAEETTRYFGKQSEIDHPARISAFTSSRGTPLSRH